MMYAKKQFTGERLTAVLLTVVLTFTSLVAVIVPYINRTDAADVPGTKTYYDARWEEAKVKAGNIALGTAYTDYQGNPATTLAGGPWMLEDLKAKVDAGTLSAPWDGTQITDAQYNALEDTLVEDYKGNLVPAKCVYTAEQFSYCVKKRFSFKLMNDIDLGGYLNRSFNNNVNTQKSFVIDGNKHTVYNYYTALNSGSGYYSLLGTLRGASATNRVTVKDLRVSNSFSNQSGDRSSIFGVHCVYVDYSNCAVVKTMVLARTRFCSGFVYVGNYVDISNCYTDTVMTYSQSTSGSGDNAACTSNFVSGVYATCNITNSFAINGMTISNGGHSGGFTSCNNGGNFTNCFTNVEVYGNYAVGAFCGVAHGGEHIFTNCYSSGKVEGIQRIGGFVGYEQVDGTAVRIYCTNCYSTAMVGMMSGATEIGGFAGTLNSSSTTSMLNCYAAGEVGSIDMHTEAGRTTEKLSGGFIGNKAGKLTINSSYYDKQSTAMREWAIGSSTNVYTCDYTQEHNIDLTGVLSTDTVKSGTGLTSAPSSNGLGTSATGNLKSSFTGFTNNDEWTFEEGYYPQLYVFSNPTTFTNTNWISQANLKRLIQANSKASTSTVLLATWDNDYDGNPLPKETYDTVRDITAQFSFTSGTGTNSGYNYQETTKKIASSQADLALHKPITASKQISSTYSAAKANDGDEDTRWAAGSGTVSSWIQVDLGYTQSIGSVRLYWYSGSHIATAYEIQVSDDATTWTTVGTETGNTSPGWRNTLLPTETRARYVRMVTVETVGNVDLAIFSIYAPEATDYAMGRPVQASSYYSESYLPEYAVNGNPEKSWAPTAEDGANAWIQVDLGRVIEIDEVGLNWTNTDQIATEYDIQTSDDGNTWTTVTSVIGNTTANNRLSYMQEGISGRYVRMQIRKTTGDTPNLSGFSVHSGGFDYTSGQSIAEVSTTTSTSRLATNAFDKSISTYWSTTTADTAPSFTLDLGEELLVKKVNLYEPSTNSNRWMNYTISISTDKINWTPVYTSTLQITGWRTAELTTPQNARYIKIYGTKPVANQWVGISEIEVISDTSATTTVDIPDTDWDLYWERCGVTGSATLATGTGAKSDAFVIDSTAAPQDVFKLFNDNGLWIGDKPMPGVDWAKITANVGDQSAYRALRICPRTGIDAGLSRVIGKGMTYDHADDMMMVYTTGARVTDEDTTNDYTYGVFPDNPVADRQQQLLNLSAFANYTALETKYNSAGQNDAFADIDTAYMERTEQALTTGVNPSASLSSNKINAVVIRQILSENSDGSLLYGTTVDLTQPDEANRWNGNGEFYPVSDNTHRLFEVGYYWSLSDGRYLYDSKRIEYPEAGSTHNVTIKAQNPQGYAINNSVYLDAYNISMGNGLVDPSITANLGSSTKAKDILPNQPHASPAATSWKLTDDPMTELKIAYTYTNPDNGLRSTWEERFDFDELPQNSGESKTITTKAPYRAYIVDTDGNTIWKIVLVEKDYIVTLDSSGEYKVAFNMEKPDYGNGVYIEDVDMDIDVTVIVDAPAPPVTEGYSFIVKKTLTAPAEEDELFVFKAEYRGNSENAGAVENTMYATIKIKAGDNESAVTFTGVPSGWYTVTEMDANWRFELDTDALENDNEGAAIDRTNGSVTYWVGR